MDSVHGVEPWISDGSTAGTKLIKDINPGLPGSSPEYFRGYKNVVQFTATDTAHGSELWKTDGTETGTTLVKDVVPGQESSYPQSEIVSGDLLFFRAGSNAWWSDVPAQIFRSDGSDSGTVSILPIESKFLTDVEGTLFFSGNANGQDGLWKSDGTQAGTVLVDNVARLPMDLRNFKGTLMFTADDGVNGREIWKSDGTEKGTMLVSDIVPGRVGSSPTFLTIVNGLLFFTANDGIHGTELWMTDGR
jgi:ELWxxDGT repeat protein